jgi:hypothetical protein
VNGPPQANESQDFKSSFFQSLPVRGVKIMWVVTGSVFVCYKTTLGIIIICVGEFFLIMPIVA